MRPLNISIVTAFIALLRRDLLLAYRCCGDLVNPLVFSLIVCSLFALAIGPDPGQLAVTSASIVWVVALLACLLASDLLFRTDYDDGSLEQMVLSPVALYWQVLAKCCAHWLVTGLPLTIVAPLLGLLLQLPMAGMLALVWSMALGTVSLSFIAGIGASLTVGLRRGSGVLLSLIVLPLYVPVLIIGISTVQMAIDGSSIGGLLAVLGACLMLAITLAPLAIAAGVRMGVSL